MWKAFFSLRSSATFISRWLAFLQDAGAVPMPILYQSLTDILLRLLIHRQYNIATTTEATTAASLSSNEGNALRYAAGYIVRSVSKKIKKSSVNFKDDLTSCCLKLIRESHNHHEQCVAEEWTDLVNRGGLWHVRETTFQLLCALEEEVRSQLHALSSPNTSGLRSQIVDKLINSEDVHFYWCITTADFNVEDDEVHNYLLRMIVNLFVTVRGFSYASSWIEHHKQSLKKSTQRSKSLRKKIVYRL